MRFIDPDTEYPGIWGNACARATVGNMTSAIWFDRTNTTCPGSWLTETIPHEIGHAFGFWHVADPRAIIVVRKPGHRSGRISFDAREQYHMLLAYDAGRGRPYCGWPIAAACPPSRALQPRLVAPQIIVAD